MLCGGNKEKKPLQREAEHTTFSRHQLTGIQTPSLNICLPWHLTQICKAKGPAPVSFKQRVLPLFTMLSPDCIDSDNTICADSD